MVLRGFGRPSVGALPFSSGTAGQHIARLVDFRKEEPLGWVPGLATQGRDQVELIHRHEPLKVRVSTVREDPNPGHFRFFVNRVSGPSAAYWCNERHSNLV